MKYAIVLCLLACGCQQKATNTDRLAKLMNDNESVHVFSRHGWSVYVSRSLGGTTMTCDNKKTLDAAIDCVEKKIKCLSCCEGDN